MKNYLCFLFEHPQDQRRWSPPVTEDSHGAFVSSDLSITKMSQNNNELMKILTAAHTDAVASTSAIRNSNWMIIIFNYLHSSTGAMLQPHYIIQSDINIYHIIYCSLHVHILPLLITYSHLGDIKGTIKGIF